jgi:hypothetical protein
MLSSIILIPFQKYYRLEKGGMERKIIKFCKERGNVLSPFLYG